MREESMLTSSERVFGGRSPKPAPTWLGFDSLLTPDGRR
jgi:hypothetical protein